MDGQENNIPQINSRAGKLGGAVEFPREIYNAAQQAKN